jgi:hypothetical protein
MSAVRQPDREGIEALDLHPRVDVQEPEYRRLLGYPRDHQPGERACELSAWARHTYAEHARPWVYLREVELQIVADRLRLDGVEFRSAQLLEHLRAAGATRAVLAVVCAGRGCEEHARQLWEESKPDEYFFLEMFGSAVVEQLTAALSGRICDAAERDGMIAIPHYSPGYSGWDIADQNRLFDLIVRGAGVAFPEPIEVLTSGMLKPKKSLLAVVGLTARTADALANSRLLPCENCSYSPCSYRRMPYRHAAPAAPAAPARTGSYTVNPRALRKWAQERVRLEPRPDGSLAATFRFDGTTCSNMGRALAFDYVVKLSRAEEGHTIIEADCRPAAGDDGYQAMCAYLSDAPKLMQAIAS